jgi:SAM-dependent methyltransferase
MPLIDRQVNFTFSTAQMAMSETTESPSEPPATDSPKNSSTLETDLYANLPKHNSDYSNVDYWNVRFKEEKEYEWLMSYSTLRDLLRPRINFDSRILIVGCGNSPFSAEMYDDGYHNIVNIDFSKVVIDEMRQRHQEARPIME